jgi:hypothetical protein
MKRIGGMLLFKLLEGAHEISCREKTFIDDGTSVASRETR